MSSHSLVETHMFNNNHKKVRLTFVLRLRIRFFTQYPASAAFTCGQVRVILPSFGFIPTSKLAEFNLPQTRFLVPSSPNRNTSPGFPSLWQSTVSCSTAYFIPRSSYCFAISPSLSLLRLHSRGTSFVRFGLHYFPSLPHRCPSTRPTLSPT